MTKLNFIWGIAISLLLMNSCKNAPDSDSATTSEAKEVETTNAGTTYKVDTAASKVEWVGTKVSSYHVGTIKVSSGELQVKDGNVTGGKFTMNAKSIVVSGPSGTDAGKNAKLTGHLHSADFFDTEKYPEATFEITAVKPFTGTVAEEDDPRQADLSAYKVSSPTHTISGNLTMKGITKNIEFPARVTITDNSVDALAKFNIDRTQWDIVYPGAPDDLIRNEVNLGIALKATK